MRNTNKKGFTIVELVVVVAVIAILAAVLIPTFSGVIKKANLTADQAAVKQMNEALAQDEAINGKPANAIKAMEVLAKAGYNGDGLVPVTADHAFWWNPTYNIVVLANVKDGAWELVYPTKYAGAGDDLASNSGCTDLAFASSDEEDVKAALDVVEKINAGETSVEVTTAADVKAIANASKFMGESFNGVTITLDANVTVDEPIQFNKFSGTLDGNGNTITTPGLGLVHSGEDANGYLYTKYFEKDITKSKTGYGFINYLGEGAVIKDLTINYDGNLPEVKPDNKYTYFGGVVGVLDGGTVSNCTVTGKINQYNRVGGIVGAAFNGTIENCTVSAEIYSNVSTSGGGNYDCVGGIVAYCGDSELEKGSLTIKNCTFSGKLNGADKPYSSAALISYIDANMDIVIENCNVSTDNVVAGDNSNYRNKVLNIGNNKYGNVSITVKNTMIDGEKATTADFKIGSTSAKTGTVEVTVE
ncbi:MAG: prepilin-type N-terminal cleavage/methylation domain-containing protein [Ruminococcaceae bacterium]|nr:prepilin-type N-terminal cleavage/methylation domain-containing protein [Oscillospiraceae bacterium]